MSGAGPLYEYRTEEPVVVGVVGTVGYVQVPDEFKPRLDVSVDQEPSQVPHELRVMALLHDNPPHDPEL